MNKIKFGDECTKFFHGMAIISFRRNTISQLLNEQGIWIQDHEGKAGLLWSSFRKRMGVSSDPVMVFDLHSLVQAVDDLDALIVPILHDEVDSVIKKMP